MTVKLIEKSSLTEVQTSELQTLLAEVRPLDFKSSKKLSDYIVEYQLGRKYPSITGTVKMEEEGTQWDFKGGLHPDIYKIICDELHLSSQGSKAKVVGFERSEESRKPKLKLRENKNKG